MEPPNLEPSTCDNKKYTPPLSTLHRSHIPTADNTVTNAIHTEIITVQYSKNILQHLAHERMYFTNNITWHKTLLYFL